jgi:hypothetical protein
MRAWLDRCDSTSDPDRGGSSGRPYRKGVITCQPNGDCGTGTVAMSKVVNGQWVAAE